MNISTEIQIDRAELERRVADYTGTATFQEGIEALASAYRERGLPVPPYEVLRASETGKIRQCLERLMACKVKGRPRHRGVTTMTAGGEYA